MKNVKRGSEAQYVTKNSLAEIVRTKSERKLLGKNLSDSNFREHLPYRFFPSTSLVALSRVNAHNSIPKALEPKRTTAKRLRVFLPANRPLREKKKENTSLRNKLPSSIC